MLTLSPTCTEEQIMSTFTDNQVVKQTRYEGGGTAYDDPDRIHVGWTIVNICVLSALIILFNVFPDRIGVILSIDDPSSFVPLLAPDFFKDELPRLNLWWGLALALNVVNLYYGRWHRGTRLAAYALTVFAMLILVRLIGRPVVGPDLERVVLSQPLVQVEQNLVPFLPVLVKVVLVVALIATIVALGKKLNQLRSGKPVDPLLKA